MSRTDEGGPEGAGTDSPVHIGRPEPVGFLEDRETCPEKGAGTLLMAGLAMLALLLAATLILMVQAATGASKAATAADLAALAAADAARGITVGEPCAQAAATAEQQGAELVRCDVEDTGTGTVVVEVVVGTSGPLPDATGSSRAGPPG